MAEEINQQVLDQVHQLYPAVYADIADCLDHCPGMGYFGNLTTLLPAFYECDLGLAKNAIDHIYQNMVVTTNHVDHLCFIASMEFYEPYVDLFRRFGRHITVTNDQNEKVTVDLVAQVTNYESPQADKTWRAKLLSLIT